MAFETLDQLFRWDHTDHGRMRLWFDELLQQGYYCGHHLIGRDTKIDKGVYIGQTSREAIVVDFTSSVFLSELFEEAKERCELIRQCRHPPFLETVYHLVRERMRYDEEQTMKIITQENAKMDGLISLDRFIEAGVGVCRHQALFAGILMEKATEEFIVPGRVSVDRNSIGYLAHAWDRFTFPSAKTYILNLSPPGYIGTLEDSMKEARGWYFLRPEDEKRLGVRYEG